MFKKRDTSGKKIAGRNLLAPLRDSVPNYNIRINAQVNNLDETLGLLEGHMNTSLDLLLRQGIGNLKSSVTEYNRLIEQILLVRGVLSSKTSLRKRSASDLVSLAGDTLKFYGGDRVIRAEKFLGDIANVYLAQVDETVFKGHLQAVKQDFEVLRLFILKN